MPIVVMLGTQGSGKTTILERAKGYRGIKNVNLGDMMCEYAIRKGYVKTRDEIRYKMTWKRYQELYKAAFSKIGAMKGNVVVDTHPFVKAGGRYVPGLPAKYMNLLKGLVGLVYVDARTEEIIKRRALDSITRKREVDDANKIDMHRTVNLAIVSYYSSHFDIPFYIIGNRDGKLDRSVKEFRGAVSELFWEKR